MNIKIKTALISVSDKSGLDLVVQNLHNKNISILSTGGTAQFIKDLNIPVINVSEITNFPEIMDGRVKTLHPNIHGGLLSIRDNPQHIETQKKYDIRDIDLLIVNLYPFESTVNSGENDKTCIENIDIGGPAMLRSASKNYQYVTVISSTEDYPMLIDELDKNNGNTSVEFRKKCSSDTFRRTAYYDTVISDWFSQDDKNLKNTLIVPAKISEKLRYGENPHQIAGIYKSSNQNTGIPYAKLIQGKNLSYNNINDSDAALQLIKEFKPADGPAVAIIKHANPCGVAKAKTLYDAYIKAFSCDTSSAFGGIIALNDILDESTAKKIIEIFTEVIIAPAVTDKAKIVISAKKNLRLLIVENMFENNISFNFKSIEGGVLVQSNDNHELENNNLNTVTKISPNESQLKDMLFSYKVCKHVKSNAIVYVKNEKTIGIGAGQMSRLNSAKIAVAKNLEMANVDTEENSLKGCTVASDAFFPFPDGLLVAIESGANAVIQPGGSLNDEDVIKTADNAKVTMAFTGIRHFKH